MAISSHFISPITENAFRLHLIVEGMHCPSCVTLIEGALQKLPEITKARLNLSTKRLVIEWQGQEEQAAEFERIIEAMGYRAAPYDPETSETFTQREEKLLLRCLAVAGFASGNLMLFSVPLWSGDSTTMGEGTRVMLQWFQALIAIPATAYCGRPFFESAWKALREKHTNMDVPISVAVILAILMSLFEVITRGEHAYFDSAVMLLFFLLIGRYFEARAKGKARSAAQDLLKMMAGSATIQCADGTLQTIPLSALEEGMVVQVAAGEKIGADGIILTGESELDTSLITGETLPRTVKAGDTVFAGMLNLNATIILRITKAGEKSLLAEIIRLMETAEQSQARYVTLADKISHWYTPVVHILAAATFLGWWLGVGISWQIALLYAATVLIITCPCALGLAVPVVQVLASGKLMRQGILLKSGSALERLSGITHAIFDKTGTLTQGKPVLLHPEQYPPETLQLAASLASQSRHPLAKAIAAAWKGNLHHFPAVEEIAGQGMAAHDGTKNIRLGKASWCGAKAIQNENPELWLAVEGEAPIRFECADILRSDAAGTLSYLKQKGVRLQLLSGDRESAVMHIATQLGITETQANLTPDAKVKWIEALKAEGAQVLMVGDGLNDAPSLAAASISMSPSSAMDITQNAADIVFQGEKLEPVISALKTATFSQKLVRQNFLLAIGYNVIAIPLAVAGYVTPLIAAIAMSASSLVVIANAMRLNFRRA